jgi:hypothetical protein
LLLPHRKLLKEGAFRILVGKKEKRHIHQVLLFNDILVCISRSKLKKPNEFAEPSNVWPLGLVWFCKGESRNVEVTGPSHSYTLLCESDEEQKSWLSALHSAIRDDQKVTDDELPAERRASFTFSNQTHYSGWWKDGKVSRLHHSGFLNPKSIFVMTNNFHVFCRNMAKEIMYFSEILMKEPLLKIQCPDQLALSPTPQERFTRVVGKITCLMVKELLVLQLVIPTMEAGVVENVKGW